MQLHIPIKKWLNNINIHIQYLKKVNIPAILKKNTKIYIFHKICFIHIFIKFPLTNNILKSYVKTLKVYTPIKSFKNIYDQLMPYHKTQRERGKITDQLR